MCESEKATAPGAPSNYGRMNGTFQHSIFKTFSSSGLTAPQRVFRFPFYDLLLYQMVDIVRNPIDSEKFRFTRRCIRIYRKNKRKQKFSEGCRLYFSRFDIRHSDCFSVIRLLQTSISDFVLHYINHILSLYGKKWS